MCTCTPPFVVQIFHPSVVSTEQVLALVIGPEYTEKADQNSAPALQCGKCEQPKL